eukprot:CAMPEP_0178961480 /NCGR_PEP_ID=MMETSP0789-20121207/13732_1 /TAXON_ID=3005 /ORGANISM="Rhizosolenia setigera, Strain CCMP 1694" /LENGTH=372 /DNA_ID=CAMNT_0020645323 /DNA_START=174 /DNA_END=1292 /DNA_ORIENTATION=+
MAQSSKLSILSSQTLKRKNSGGKQFDFPPDILQQVEEFKTKNQMKFESTIVSAFFELSPGNSKRGNNDYLEYMENFLCINDPVVVFTQPKYVNKMRELRSHAPDRTLIVPMELQDIEVGYNIHFSDEEWQNNCKLHIDRGCKNGFEKDGNLYKIWLAKSWFVNEALRLNPFGSDIFLWMDIGHLREGDFFCGDTVVRHPEIVPQDGRMLLFMWRGLKEGDELRYQNPIFSDGFYSFYIAGGSLAGRIDAWGHFLQKMEESMILYHERGVGIVEDQSIMQSTCMRNKGLCSVVRIGNDQGVGDGKGLCREGKYERFRMCLDRPGWRGNVNSFFQMKFRYYHGGPLKTFDPALGIPSRAEDPDFYFLLPATHNN